jgi:maltooligosyltrehalose trehalohydrolase
MIFMGDETGGRSPFLFFTDHNADLAQTVRDGRRNEFRKFSSFQSEQARARIPDPNAEETFLQSMPKPDESDFNWFDFYHALLSLRSRLITPHLEGARTVEAKAISDYSVMARWRLGNGDDLMLAANFGTEALPFEIEDDFRIVTPSTDSFRGNLPPQTTLAWMKSP